MHPPEKLLKLVEPWEMQEAGELLRTSIFALKQRFAHSRSDPARRGTFVYVDTPDWVNVIAITPERQVVLIEQFRHGRAEVTLEIPGGMVDAGEAPLAAAVRELREETGYVGERATLIGAPSPNPATHNNLCHIALVRDARPSAERHLDHNEEIGVRLVPLAQVDELIKRGVIHHALVVAAFHYLSLLAI